MHQKSNMSLWVFCSCSYAFKVSTGLDFTLDLKLSLYSTFQCDSVILLSVQVSGFGINVITTVPICRHPAEDQQLKSFTQSQFPTLLSLLWCSCVWLLIHPKYRCATSSFLDLWIFFWFSNPSRNFSRISFWISRAPFFSLTCLSVSLSVCIPLMARSLSLSQSHTGSLWSVGLFLDL